MTNFPLAVGDLVSYRTGDTTITLQRIREDVWRVTVEKGSPVAFLVEDECSSWGDETLARDAARGLARLYRYGVATAVAM